MEIQIAVLNGGRHDFVLHGFVNINEGLLCEKGEGGKEKGEEEKANDFEL